MAKGSIRFERDEKNDIVIAYPKWHIETEEDCKVWLAQYEAYFAPFGRRVDIIVVLDEFSIGNGIGSVWGSYRAEIHKRFTRHSVRVHANAKVRTYSATSGALHGVPSDEARDVPTAIALIHEHRRHGA